MRTAGMRKLGPEALTEAITVPSAFRTGAAMAVSPASSSSTAVAKPRDRTSASRAGNSAAAVTVRSVNRASGGLGQVGQQDLAVRGRVQRNAPPGPVVRGERRRAGRLVQVERVAAGQDGQV